MWKLRWLTEIIFNWKVYKSLSGRLQKPFSFYSQLILKLINDKPRLVKIPLKSGKVFYAYRIMDLYKLYEIFIMDDYRIDMSQASYIVDIGGNKGYFSLRMSEQFPEANFYCYEPEPANYSNLKTLLQENGVNYEAYQEGVGGENGKFELYINPKNDGGHSLFKKGLELQHISVNIVTLDTVLGRLPAGLSVNLLKLDCEGAEKGIMMSMNSDHAKRIEHILYEPTYDLYDPADVNAHLVKLGYDVTNEHGIFKASRKLTKSF